MPQATYSGDPARPTVDDILKAPKALQALVLPENTQFLTDELFRADTTGDSGTVTYGVTGRDASDDVAGVLAEGSEIPTIDLGDRDQQLAQAEELGLGYHITDKARRRNQGWLVDQGNARIRKGILKQNARRVRNVLDKAVADYDLGINAVGTWDQPKAMRASILAGLDKIRDADLDYEATTVIVHPNTLSTLLLLDEYANLAPRENKAENPFYSRTFDGVLGLRWLFSTQIAKTDAYLAEPKSLGVNLTELPFGVDTERYAARRSTFVFGLESSVPVVTDPYSLVKITGISA